MAGIKLDLSGFTEMLKNVEKAQGDVDAATSRAVNECANIVEAELKAQASAKKVPSSITSAIRKSVEVNADVYSAKVGWTLDSYDPRNPSAGYKAIFLNYGTVRRQTRAGKNRGAIEKPTKSGQFIYAAKKSAATKCKNAKQNIIDTIMRDLKK